METKTEHIESLLITYLLLEPGQIPSKIDEENRLRFETLSRKKTFNYLRDELEKIDKDDEKMMDFYDQALKELTAISDKKYREFITDFLKELKENNS